MSDGKAKRIEIYLQEYDNLKQEQGQRIGFRDNIIYVTLGLFGGVLSFVLSDQTHHYALLVIPCICLILGWTYLVNDEKISAIGEYIDLTLSKKIQAETGHADHKSIFGWESFHRSDKRRTRRKIEQLIIDEITFVLSGIIALFAFWFSASNIPGVIHTLCAIELIALLTLGTEIIIYADLAKER